MNFLSLFKRNLIYKFKNKISIDNDLFDDKTLDFLFNYYGSDKANKFNQNAGHGFSRFYVKHFEPLRDKEIKILEIGSYAGASAAAFSKYFPRSKIFCFDVNISNFKFTSKYINVYGLDIKNQKKIKKILTNIFKKYSFDKFDIIIDDGSHFLSDILSSLSILFTYLKQNGTYIIEDYKHPNYYKYNKDTEDILIDDLILKLKNKTHFDSNYLNHDIQTLLINSIEKIDVYEGNLQDSDICFIKKK